MSVPVRLTLAGHTFVVTPTERCGINTGRRRYRVECETCGTVEATTDAAERIRSHIVWMRVGDEDEALMLRSVVRDALELALASATTTGLLRLGNAVALWAGMARLWAARCQKCGGNTHAGNPYGEECTACDGRGWRS